MYDLQLAPSCEIFLSLIGNYELEVGDFAAEFYQATKKNWNILVLSKLRNFTSVMDSSAWNQNKIK